MRSVGVRELKQQASAVLRDVREKGETVGITYRGRVVAHLVPVEQPPPSEEELEAMFARIDDLAERIGALWPEGVTAEEAVRDVRREL